MQHRRGEGAQESDKTGTEPKLGLLITIHITWQKP